VNSGLENDVGLHISGELEITHGRRLMKDCFYFLLYILYLAHNHGNILHCRRNFSKAKFSVQYQFELAM